MTQLWEFCKHKYWVIDLHASVPSTVQVFNNSQVAVMKLMESWIGMDAKWKQAHLKKYITNINLYNRATILIDHYTQKALFNILYSK